MDASLSSSFHKLNENIVEFNRLGYLTLPHKYKSLINKTLQATAIKTQQMLKVWKNIQFSCYT